MAIAARLKEVLDTHHIAYTARTHQTAYTAQEIAAAQHVPGRQLAKCVLINTDRDPVLAVLPAVQRVDLKRLKALLGARTATIAKEADIKQRFPDVEVGAMSPFGNLYSVPVVVDRALGESEEIVFNAGSHTETIKMAYRDFAALVKPKAGSFGQSISPPGARPRKAAKAHAGKRPRRTKTAARATPIRTSRRVAGRAASRRGGRSS